QAEDGIRDFHVTGVQTCALPIYGRDITTSPSHQIARLGLGLVPEGRQIFPNLSVEENLLATARKPARATPASWTLEKVYALFPRSEERRVGKVWEERRTS